GLLIVTGPGGSARAPVAGLVRVKRQVPSVRSSVGGTNRSESSTPWSSASFAGVGLAPAVAWRRSRCPPTSRTHRRWVPSRRGHHGEPRGVTGRICHGGLDHSLEASPTQSTPGRAL